MSDIHSTQFGWMLSHVNVTLSGRERIKHVKQKLASPDKMRIASCNALLKLASSLRVGLNWGLEEYVPCVRLLPGQSLPPDLQDSMGHSTLTIVSDEGPDMKLSQAFLKSVGLRVRWEKDFSHRYDNTHTCAVTDADYDDILAKIQFLSKVNKGPWDSAKNLNVKAELFDQLRQVTQSDERILEQAEADFLFDQGSQGFWSDSKSEEMLSGSKSIFWQTEAMEGKRFFSMIKQWPDVDRSWTMEFLNLDVYFKGQGKVNPLATLRSLVYLGWIYDVYTKRTA